MLPLKFICYNGRGPNKEILKALSNIFLISLLPFNSVTVHYLPNGCCCYRKIIANRTDIFRLFRIVDCILYQTGPVDGNTVQCI